MPGWRVAAHAPPRTLVPDADEAICRACHAATGGNPVLLHELARAARDGRVAPTNVAAQSPERVTRAIIRMRARVEAGAEHDPAVLGTIAEVDARTLREIAVGYGWPLGAGFAAAALGEVLLERGELDEAARVLGDEPLPHVYANVWVLRVRGLLRRAQGDLEGAAAELRECGQRASGIDHVNPAVLPWRSALAEVLHALGRPSDLAREELDRARVFGGRRCLGIALRAAGVVEDDHTLLQAAVAVLDASEAALERARAHAALGAALHRAGETEPARERLRYAIDAAHRCGARALEDEALTELRATGARPRRRLATGKGALTPSERRIAELTAAGQQNREIAETLFVTTATVEYHLRNAYRKLGIASRTQLEAALS